MTESDREKFCDGDELIFRMLVRKYSPQMLALISSYATNEDDSSDLLQECWLRIYKQRRTYRGDAPVLSWFLAIARNVCLESKRSNESQRRREGGYASERRLAVQPANDLHVYDMLAALPERQRAAVILRVIDGQSTKQAAALLDCAEGTVKALLHQGLSALRKQLRE